MSAISINKEIYSLLINDEDLNAIVSRKIYPLIAEESTTFPFIIFKRNNVNTSYIKDGKTHDEADFSVAIAAKDYTTTVDIAERVREILELKRNDYFNRITFTSISEDYVDDAYLQELNFNAIIN